MLVAERDVLAATLAVFGDVAGRVVGELLVVGRRRGASRGGGAGSAAPPGGRALRYLDLLTSRRNQQSRKFENLSIDLNIFFADLPTPQAII